MSTQQPHSPHYEQLWQSFVQDQDADLTNKFSQIPALQQVWEASDYVYQQSHRSPELVIDLFESDWLTQSFEPGQMRELLQSDLAVVADDTQLSIKLRQFRRKQMVRIIWRDIGRLAPLNETLEDLSELADVCVDEAVRFLFERAVSKSGMPCDPAGKAQDLIVIGMGKLGARELNLSSDIDLIFCYPERGQTDGRRPLDNEQFFTRLARQVIKVIGENTAEGFVFRVDTRLRPFGDSGPLAIPLSFLEDYLQRQARDWERYAMVKARVISGSGESVEAFQSLIKPFVYRRYLDYSAIESIRDMKKLIVNEMHNRGMDANIKLGRGGIREIEFIAQAFQLIRGGRDPDLQIRPVQQVLKKLAEKEILPGHEVTALLSAYEFLRLTENRLQAWKDQQTHVLPNEDDDMQRLAVSMGFDDVETFLSELESHRNNVHGYFDLFFAAPQADEKEKNAFDEIWEEGISQEAAIYRLDLAGFESSEEIWSILHGFRESRVFRNLGVNGRRRIDQLMPLLLEAVAASKQADEVLRRLMPFLESISRRTAYLALMVENPLVLSQLIRLVRESAWIAEQMVRHPILLDELIDPRRLYSPLKQQALKEELRVSLEAVTGDEEQAMERLRLFVQANMLRVAAADVTNVIPVEVVSDYLTDIAEVTTDAVYRIALDFMQQKHGLPQATLGKESGFAVVGYGKVGGWELGYSSDLDLVFLNDSQNNMGMTDGASGAGGQKSIANDVFYARLGQRMIHQFTTRMSSGQLYEVDMRLRPNGNSGMLVSSLNAFEKYQLEEAWTWEHQALVRARAIAGDPLTMAGFEKIRAKILQQKRDISKLQQEVREMREKMRTSLDKSDPEQFDIKQGVGGIADIEFMVQYAVLRWASEYPELVEWSDNARILEMLADKALLPNDLAEKLLKAYRAYRAEYHRRALQQQKGIVPQSGFTSERKLVANAWQELMINHVSG